MKIIFVCTGNTCRSPLAESYAKSKFVSTKFSSRGLMVGSHHLSSQSAEIIKREALASPSRPEQLNLEDTKDSLLLVMTKSHKRMVESHYPGADVMLISEFADGSLNDIADPFGGSGRQYETAFEQLKFYIDQFDL